jgi:kinesin family member 1
MQTLTGKEIFEWLYALNPLLAGELRSKLARVRENKSKNAPLSNLNSTSTPTKP